MSVSNFFSLVLFILSFSLPSILPDPHCLSRHFLFLLPLHFYKLSAALPHPHLYQPNPSPFHPNCSFLWTLQLCCSAFRRCEYLQFCMFGKPLVGERFSSLQLCIYVCVLHDCLCGCMYIDFFVYGCVCVHIFVCVCLVCAE